MIDRVSLAVLVGALGLLAMVVELVRRRRLAEQYSLLWLLTGVVLVILPLWRDLLDVAAQMVGVFYAPSALFVVGFMFTLLILLHFSTVITKLSQQNREAAQRIGLLQWRLRQLEAELGADHRPPGSRGADL